MLCINNFIYDHEISSFIPGIRIWTKGPNYALLLEDTGCFFYVEETYILHFPFIGTEVVGSLPSPLMTKLEKLFLLLLIYLLWGLSLSNLKGHVGTGNVIILGGCLAITLWSTERVWDMLLSELFFLRSE